MSFDPEKLVHEPRGEDHGGRINGRDYVFTPSGEYVFEAGIVPFDNANELKLIFRIGFPDQWSSFLEDYNVVDTGENRVANFDQNILGAVDDSQVDNYRTNRWCELEDENWDVYIDNIGSEAASRLEVYGSGELEEFAHTAATYAEGLAAVDLEPGNQSVTKVQSQEELWTDLFRKSIGNAVARLEEVDSKYS